MIAAEPAGRCIGTNRNGSRCKRWPLIGQTRCSSHVLPEASTTPHGPDGDESSFPLSPTSARTKDSTLPDQDHTSNSRTGDVSESLSLPRLDYQRNAGQPIRSEIETARLFTYGLLGVVVLILMVASGALSSRRGGGSSPSANSHPEPTSLQSITVPESVSGLGSAKYSSIESVPIPGIAISVAGSSLADRTDQYELPDWVTEEALSRWYDQNLPRGGNFEAWIWCEEFLPSQQLRHSNWTRIRG